MPSWFSSRFFSSLPQNFKEDLNKNYPACQNMEMNGTALKEKCKCLKVSNGVDRIDGEMTDLNGRFSDLNAFADKEKERILEIGKQLDECQIQLAPVEDLIRLARRTLDEQALFGDDSDKGRILIENIEVRLWSFCRNEVVYPLSPFTPIGASLDPLRDLNQVRPWLFCLISTKLFY